MFYMVATVPAAVQSIIDTLGSLVTAFASYVSQWLTVIFTSGNELLLVAIVLPLVGIGITFIKRLMGRRL